MAERWTEDAEEARRRTLLAKAGAPLPDHTDSPRGTQGVVLTSPYPGSPQRLPEVGTVVRARINNIGECEVLGYFVDQGFLGIVALPLRPPSWYVAQNGDLHPCQDHPLQLRRSRSAGFELHRRLQRNGTPDYRIPG